MMSLPLIFLQLCSYLTVCNKDEIACPRDQSKTRCFKLNQRCDGNEQCTSRYDELNCGTLKVHSQTAPSKQSENSGFNSGGVCGIHQLPWTETTIQMTVKLAKDVTFHYLVVFPFIFFESGCCLVGAFYSGYRYLFLAPPLTIKI